MNSGISFMVRIRNEERTIEKCIRSLSNLQIPHEIVCILHLCTDRTEEILRSIENPNIKIYVYEHEVSKPGYETLATDADSKHSFVRFSSWCIEKCSLPWVFKWDADFVASSKLIDFLHSKTWNPENVTYSLVANDGTHRNRETYLLCNNQFKFKKYLFWEKRMYPVSNVKIDLPDDVEIIHNSSLRTVKNWWTRKSWYETEDSDEARIVYERIKRLENDYGKEPLGMARASNPECYKIKEKIMRKIPDYVNISN